jgi:hypothetical protein
MTLSNVLVTSVQHPGSNEILPSPLAQAAHFGGPFAFSPSSASALRRAVERRSGSSQANGRSCGRKILIWSGRDPQEFVDTAASLEALVKRSRPR